MLEKESDKTKTKRRGYIGGPYAAYNPETPQKKDL